MYYSEIAYLLRAVTRTQKHPLGAFVFLWLSMYSCLVKLSDLNRSFIAYCVKNRLGKTNFSVKVIYFITNILGKFEAYKNTVDFNKKGHYVPKLLLWRFRLAEDGPLRGKIYQFNFLSNQITEESINDVAQIKDFYIFKPKGGGHSDYVEKQIYAHFIVKAPPRTLLGNVKKSAAIWGVYDETASWGREYLLELESSDEQL
jgi:hypothetical protein